MLLDKHYGFRLMGLQLFGAISLAVLMPTVDHMICTSGIQATVGTADHIDEPGSHKLRLFTSSCCVLSITNHGQ